MPTYVRVLARGEKPYADLTCACGGPTRVTDTHGTRGAIRRRRECLECGERFTTYEAAAANESLTLTRQLRILEEIRRLVRALDST